MRLLVTRPEPDASALAEQLIALGHEPVIAPLMQVRFHDTLLDLGGLTAVLFTSANGVRAFAHQHEPPPGTIALAVGDATARTARDHGWQDVRTAYGDVTSLAMLATQTLKRGEGRIVHVCGEQAVGDLSGALAAEGYRVERRVMYVACAARELPDNARIALTGGSLDGVLLLSPRTAKLFGTLVTEAGLRTQASRLVAFCLSDAVATAAFVGFGARVKVAAKPDIGHLLALLSA